jgi:O-antigen/teichoic acid export membrane protein
MPGNIFNALTKFPGQFNNENSAILLHAIVTAIIFTAILIIFFYNRFINLRRYSKEAKIIDKTSLFPFIFAFIIIFTPIAYFVANAVPVPYSIILNLIIFILLAAAEELVRKKLFS